MGVGGMEKSTFETHLDRNKNSSHVQARKQIISESIFFPDCHQCSMQ